MIERVGLIFFMLFLTIMASCGQPTNHRQKSTSAFTDAESYLVIEKECASDNRKLEPVSIEINKTYNEVQRAHAFIFANLPMKLYDYKNPLIINLDDMAKKLGEIKKQLANPGLSEQDLSLVSSDLFYLSQNSLRFEGQKCSFPAMAKRKFQDMRPYLEMRDFCVGICSSETIVNLTPSDSKYIEERSIKLCKAFDPSYVNCQAEYNLQKKNRTLDTLVARYQNKFQKEHYDKLFSLRPTHLMYQCQKNDDVTVMTVKVYSQHLDIYSLNVLTRFVSDSWTRGNFKLNVEIADKMGSDVVEILPSTTGVSYVPDQNNRKVFLSQILNFETQKRVLAHEFGHVLGFPDCYTEYFDNLHHDLVYYEISSDNMNIMCSLKNGVSVPDDYLSQLAQNSCVFK